MDRRNVLVFFIDNRTSAGGITFFMENQTTSLVVSKSRFYNNSARPDSTDVLQRDSKVYGHGGAITARLVDSSNSSICIENSLFEHNTAQANGGAIAASMARLSNNSHFLVNNSLFSRNYIPSDNNGTGGAVGFDIFNQASFNQVTFTRCNFTNNEAYSGGAISLATSASAVSNFEGQSNQLVLTDCRFERNRSAYDGSAVSVSSLSHVNQVGIPVDVTNW